MLLICDKAESISIPKGIQRKNINLNPALVAGFFA